MTRQAVYSLAGAALLGWFGTRIGILTAAGSLPIAAFAVGIILMAQAPTFALRDRVRRLEAQLASQGESGARAG